MAGWRGDPIIGRDSELRDVSEFLDAIPAGLIALIIEGEAGIGKSTIWRHGVVQADGRGCRVLVCQPAATEARMSFAALGDLLEPVIDDVVGGLVAPQRRALDVALLRTELKDSLRDERAVSVAFLNVIRLLCKESTVLLAIDDAHWLDRPSARVLEFAVRRAASAPVGLMAAVRLDPHERLIVDLQRTVEPERHKCLRVGPLSPAALHHLIGVREGAMLPRRVLLTVHKLSGGNPFYALELARTLAEREAPLAPGEPLPVPGTLTDLVAGRLGRLPARTHEALLVASALAQPTSATIDAYDPSWSADELLDKAERRELIKLARGRVRFTHPIISSTVYAGASEAERRRVHRRLAEIVSDREQHARHLALAAEAPEERVAAALERAADTADRRGAPDAPPSYQSSPATSRRATMPARPGGGIWRPPATTSPRATGSKRAPSPNRWLRAVHRDESSPARCSC